MVGAEESTLWVTLSLQRVGKSSLGDVVAQEQTREKAEAQRSLRGLRGPQTSVSHGKVTFAVWGCSVTHQLGWGRLLVGCSFGRWEVPKILSPAWFWHVAEKQGNVKSPNLQPVLHEDKRKEKWTHVFLFCPFQRRANPSGQDSCFINELILKKKNLWMKWDYLSPKGLQSWPATSRIPAVVQYSHIWLKKHHSITD